MEELGVLLGVKRANRLEDDDASSFFAEEDVAGLRSNLSKAVTIFLNVGRLVASRLQHATSKALNSQGHWDSRSNVLGSI